MTTTIGTIELLAKIDTRDYLRGADDIKDANKDIEKSAEDTSKRSSKAFTNVAKVGLAAVASAAVAVGALIVKNFDNAIRRVDTLNNSARTFENLGFTSDDVANAMNNLEQSIRGLPTSLDEAVRGVQLLSGSTNDINKAQKVFTALNNAIIGFGGSSADVSGAIVQLSQAFSNGKIDAQTWNSLIQNNLGPALNALAREMGMTTGELKAGLSEGTISVEAFQDSLIKLNKEGGGGMKSLEQISKDATAGISTGWQNLNTAITRGIADIIESIGPEKISGAITDFSKSFESALKSVSSLVEFMVRNDGIFAPIILAITSMVTALTAWFVATKLITAAQAVFNAVLAANPIGLIIVGIIGLTAAFLYLWNNVDGFRNFFLKSWELMKNAVKVTGKLITDVAISIGKFFTSIWNGIKTAFNAVIGFFKQWGITILAVLFLPIALFVGAVIRNWDTIKAVFTAGVNFISTVISTVASVVWSVLEPVLRAIGGIFISVGNVIAAVWEGVKAGALATWNFMLAVYSPVAAWFSSVFNTVANVVSSAFNRIRSTMSSVWDWIKGVFGTIGEVAASIIKGPVNAILGFAERTINGFINAINGAIDTINNIPGVNIGKLGTLSVPQLANGGIVSAPTLAMIGEGGESEAVIPLSKLDDMMNGGGAREYNIGTINIASEVDGERWIRKLTGRQEMESSGITPTQSYMG